MPTIIVKTQAELDALPASFSEFTVIQIQGGTIYDRIIVRSMRGSSHVEAWGSSHVEAWGSSHVVAWGSSHVEAWGSVAVHNQSTTTILELGGFAVAWLLAKAKSVTLHGKNARTITPERSKGVDGWCDDEAVTITDGHVTLYKRVSREFKTQEGKANETDWTPGKTLVHPNWSPSGEECNAGKFHACSRGYFCDEFRDTRGDRYVALRVAVADLFAWPNNPTYPHKIAVRAAEVLFECDRYGKQLVA